LTLRRKRFREWALGFFGAGGLKDIHLDERDYDRGYEIVYASGTVAQQLPPSAEKVSGCGRPAAVKLQMLELLGDIPPMKRG
jgi:hypothetical protein